MVEGKLEDDTVFDKAVVYITNDSVLYGIDNNTINSNQLVEDLLVEVIITGTVRESYPVQVDAKEIRIIEPTTKE